MYRLILDPDIHGGENVGRSTEQNPEPRSRKHPRHRRVRKRRSVSYLAGIAVLVFAVGVTFGLFQQAPPKTQRALNTARPSTQGNARSSSKHGTTNSTRDNTTGNVVGIGLNSTGNSDGNNAHTTTTQLRPSAMIDVPAQNQHPELPNGCEVTSLSMLFDGIGHPVSKMILAKEEPVDPTPEVKNSSGQIVSWGNPNVGFVGSPYIWSKGFGIYHGPIINLIDKILPGEGVDLTKKPFRDLLSYVAHGTPVEAWVTITLKPTNKFWVTWQSPEGPVHTTLEEHAVLIVGYDKTNVYINNPFNGDREEAVSRSDFIGAWNQLGNQAVTIAPPSTGNQNK